MEENSVSNEKQQIDNNNKKISQEQNLENANNNKNDNILHENITPPSGVLTKMYMTRLGKILSNISIFCLFVSLASMTAMILSLLWLVIALILIIGTLGAIYVIIPNFRLVNTAESIGNFAEFLSKIVPYSLAIGIVCAIASLVLLIWDRNNIPWFRVVFSIIVIVVLLIVAIALFL